MFFAVKYNREKFHIHTSGSGFMWSSSVFTIQQGTFNVSLVRVYRMYSNSRGVGAQILHGITFYTYSIVLKVTILALICDVNLLSSLYYIM